MILRKAIAWIGRICLAGLCLYMAFIVGCNIYQEFYYETRTLAGEDC